jgi:hypothetical protein
MSTGSIARYVDDVWRGDAPPEAFSLASSTPADGEAQHFPPPDIAARGSTSRLDARGRDDELGVRLEATFAAACVMLDVRLAEIEERLGRLERELQAQPAAGRPAWTMRPSY